MASAEEQMVTDLLDVLDTRARYAVEQRFGLHDGRKRSYREVGEELGVTAEAARRLVKRAVNAVRDEAARAHRRRLTPRPAGAAGRSDTGLEPERALRRPPTRPRLSP